MLMDDSEFVGGKAISNAFASFFKSVYDKDYQSASINKQCDIFEVLSIREVQCEDVCEAIRNLKSKRAVGPDNIPSYILKGLVGFLAEPLKTLFNLSLKTNTFPQIWKEAKICPVFKKGNKAEIQNYRPIAILSCPAKIFESVIYKYTYKYVYTKISDKQHGFLTKKSTTTNLCNITQYIAESLDRKNQVDVIYTDFAKAFDKVSHTILVEKMRIEYGFHDNLVEFFSSYLHNRHQRVVVRGYYSDYFVATSGIPQGSNLGPLLFLLFINSLAGKIEHSEILMFADDVKLYKKLRNERDCYLLQQDLNNIYDWSIKHRLHFNIDKCFALSFSRKRCSIHYEYKINKLPISRVTEMKDLGVVFDAQLTFKMHIAEISNRAAKMYGFMVRSCRLFKNIHCIKILYISFVRSILEYCSVIWNPYYEIHKQGIERIQNKFLRYIYYKETGIYQLHIPKLKIMKTYNLKGLESRRIILSILLLHKLLNNQINNPNLLSLIKINVPTHRTRNPLTLHVERACTNYYKNSPVITMCRLYNQIRLYCDIFSISYIGLRNILMEIL